MAYNSAIPRATDKLSISQADIQSNFAALGVIAGISGTAGSACLNSALGFNWINFARQSGNGARPPAASFSVDSVGLYAAQSSISTYNELFVASRDYNSGNAKQIPMTLYANGAIAGDKSSSSWTYLPSGMKIISGKSALVGGTVTISFASIANFPGFQQFITNISAIRIDSSGSSSTVVRVSAFSLTSVTFQNAIGTSLAFPFFWSVMGN